MATTPRRCSRWARRLATVSCLLVAIFLVASAVGALVADSAFADLFPAMVGGPPYAIAV